MTLFNLSRWIAKEVTGTKNVDKKIYVVGPAGSGKSMTGLSLAIGCARWISYFNHEKSFSHAKEYFKFDEEHIAIINTDDFIKLMTSYPKKNSVRIIDDCGAAVGFTSRRSMSKANLDIVSIYGTNRVRNCVTIICVQDTNFTDKRMRMLADVIIDMRGYYQINDKVRAGKLYHIKMTDKVTSGYTKARFMTYENGEWSTHESIACYLPPGDVIKEYNVLREAKDKANTEMLSQKYTVHEHNEPTRPPCVCGSNDVRYLERQKCWKCKTCGIKYNYEGERASKTNTIISKSIEAQ